MESIDEKLLVLYEEKNRKDKVHYHLEELYRDMERKEIQLVDLKEIMHQEFLDVEKLESKSLYGLFLTVLGNKKQQLEKERQEYLQVFMKVEGLKQHLIILAEEKELLQKTYSGLQTVDKDFEQALSKKIELLVKVDACPPRLTEYLKKIANYRIKIKELETCIKKGEVARKYLRNVITGLDEIEQWGYENKKMSTTRIRKKIKRLNKEIYVANSFLQKFEHELGCLQGHFDFDFQREITQFQNFMDQFVDTLITDWIVKQRIFNADNLVDNLRDKIVQLSETLTYEIEKTNGYIEETQLEKADYLLNYIKS